MAVKNMGILQRNIRSSSVVTKWSISLALAYMTLPPNLHPQESVRSLIPDLSVHKVELERVVFDMLNGQYTNLSKISNREILKIRDGIRPLYEPRFERIEEVNWLTPSDRVIIFLGETHAAAYPLKILEYHEIVNDNVDGQPILVTYCPLCSSGVVFDRRMDGEEVFFGNTNALFENNMVMYDYKTLSYWVQVSGEAIVGEAFSPVLDGKRHTFEREGKSIVDHETGSVWAVTGEGVSGPLQGRQLRPLPSRIAQWFSIVRTIPDIEVYTP